VIDGWLCQACGSCVAACPSKALALPTDQDWKRTISLKFPERPL
jgi:ferredoxin